jgi:hypothetical protein
MSCNSLTSIGPYSGYNDEIDHTHGAMIERVPYRRPKYYEVITSETVEAPWLAQKQEATYMNRTKVLNEEPIFEYDELKLSEIPQDNYERYDKEMDYKVPTGPQLYVEKFDGKNKFNYFSFIMLILIVSFILFAILTKV